MSTAGSATAGAAGTRVEIVHAWGVNSKLRDAVAFPTETEVLYPTGRHVALHTLDGAQHFVPQTPHLSRCRALAVCPKQRYLAVCEHVTPAPDISVSQVSVYDLRTAPVFRKIRTLINPIKTATGEPSHLVGCAFSGDSKFLALQTGRPDWTCMVWHWFQQKMVASTEVPARVSRVSFNPIDSSQLCTSGPSHFRLWRVIEEALRPFPPFVGLKGSEQVTDHAWTLDDRIIATTQAGEVLVIDECELRQTFSSADFVGDATPLHCVAAFAKGFVAGGDAGLLAIFELPDEGAMAGRSGSDRPPFRLLRALDVRMPLVTSQLTPASTHDDAPSSATAALTRDAAPSGGVVEKKSDDGPSEDEVGPMVPVRDMCFSPSEDQLALCVDGGVGVLNVSQTWLMKEEDTAAQVNYVANGLHTSPVTDLSVCTSKPLIVTCTEPDRCVRVWDYDVKSVIVRRSFDGNGPPLSVSIHPQGYLVLVVFTGRALVCNLLADALTTAADISAKGAAQGRFSNGGAMFAIVCSKSVLVYSTFGSASLAAGGRPMPIATLSGHVGSITSVCWNNDDTVLYTASADGAVYKWNAWEMERGSRSAEAQLIKGAKYTSIVCGRGSAVVGAFTRIVTHKVGARRGSRALEDGSKGDESVGAGGRRTSGLPAPGGGGGAAGGRKRDERDGGGSGGGGGGGRRVTEEVRVVVAWPKGIEGSLVQSSVPEKATKLFVTRVSDGSDTVFAGSDGGAIFELMWPPSGTHDVVQAHGVHAGGVTGLGFSGDACFMVSAAADGSMVLCALSDSIDAVLSAETGLSASLAASSSGGGSGGASKRLARDPLAGAASSLAGLGGKRAGAARQAEQAAIDALNSRRRALESFTEKGESLVLVPAQAISEAKYRVREAREQLNDMRSEHTHQLELEVKRAADETSKRDLEWAAERSMTATQLAELRKARTTVEAELREAMAAQEARHLAAAEELQSLYEKKLSLSAAKYDELKRQYDDLKTAAEAKHVDLLATQKATQDHMLGQFKHKVNTQRKAHGDLKAYLEYVKKEYDAMLMQQEREHDAEVIALKAKITGAAQELDQARTRAKGESVQLQNTVGVLKEALDKAHHSTADMERRAAEEAAKRAQMAVRMGEMQHEVEAHLRELRERDAQLAESHRKVKDLERSRRVLQQQLQDLKSTLQPRDREIDMLREQIRELDSEYDRGVKVADKRDQLLTAKTRRVAGLQARQAELETALRDKAAVVANFCRALDVIVRETPQERWRAAVVKLHAAFVGGVGAASLGKLRKGKRKGGKGGAAAAGGAAGSGPGARDVDGGEPAGDGDGDGGAVGATGDGDDDALFSDRDGGDEREGSGGSDDEGAAGEFHRQRKYLERSISVLRKKAAREEAKAHRSFTARFTENGTLIMEVNDLRRENKALAQKAERLQSQLNAERSRSRLGSALASTSGSALGASFTALEPGTPLSRPATSGSRGSAGVQLPSRSGTALGPRPESGPLVAYQRFGGAATPQHKGGDGGGVGVGPPLTGLPAPILAGGQGDAAPTGAGGGARAAEGAAGQGAGGGARGETPYQARSRPSSGGSAALRAALSERDRQKKELMAALEDTEQTVARQNAAIRDLQARLDAQQSAATLVSLQQEAHDRASGSSMGADRPPASRQRGGSRRRDRERDRDRDLSVTAPAGSGGTAARGLSKSGMWAAPDASSGLPPALSPPRRSGTAPRSRVRSVKSPERFGRRPAPPEQEDDALVSGVVGQRKDPQVMNSGSAPALRS